MQMSVDLSRVHKEKPISILFVCLGNICRSPAADGIMHYMVDKANLQGTILIDSAGTYAGHTGSLPDNRMRQHALRRGYVLNHRARKVSEADFEKFDLLVAMDDRNYYDLTEMAPSAADEARIVRMTDFLTHHTADHVPDPYYEGAEGFEKVLDLLEDGCAGLLAFLQNRQK